jgi:hypothetical protein
MFRFPVTITTVLLLGANTLLAQTGTLPPNADPNAARTVPGTTQGAATPGTPGNGEGSSAMAPQTGCAGEIARAEQQIRTVKEQPKRERALADLNQAKERLNQKDEEGCRSHAQTALREMR